MRLQKEIANRILHILLLFFVFTLTVPAQQPEKVTAQPTIKDLRGRELSPFQPDGSKASVFIFLLKDCPISNRYAPEIVRLASDYQEKRIRFFLVFLDDAKGLEKHLMEYGLADLPAIFDEQRLLVKATGVQIAPECAVIGTKGEILYRGRIDNLYAALGKPRRQITEHDLRDALDAIIDGRQIKTPRTTAIGCFISSEN
jgi:AhpC/TSA family